ncbi:hypothetical protein CSB37_04175 [bacterium DOLZORAL124_38_8]|nr:MAG: hypothetical protein CSB37_04175 [bacterium DOLZORAL124_38_8]
MKKYILAFVFIVFLLVPFYPYQETYYKDGGTKLYTSYLYQYIKFNTLEGCTEAVLSWYPQNNKSYDDYWQQVCKKNHPQATKVTYSNLVDKKSQDFVKNVLAKYEVAEKNIEDFFYYVDYFNKAVKNEGLVSSDFVELKNTSRDGGYPLYLEKLEQYNLDFMGTNCRISSFSLLRDLIDVKDENPVTEEDRVLMFDNGAVENFPKPIFSDTDKKKFVAFFRGIPTPRTKDQAVHVKTMKDYWKKHQISFKTPKGMSLVMLINHDDLDDVLFVGHVGVLLKSDGKYLFLEKLSFDLPYQAILFNKKSQVKDYFMKKYGDMVSEETAKPFLMENDELFD